MYLFAKCKQAMRDENIDNVDVEDDCEKRSPPNSSKTSVMFTNRSKDLLCYKVEVKISQREVRWKSQKLVVRRTMVKWQFVTLRIGRKRKSTDWKEECKFCVMLVSELELKTNHFSRGYPNCKFRTMFP